MAARWLSAASVSPAAHASGTAESARTRAASPARAQMPGAEAKPGTRVPGEVAGSENTPVRHASESQNPRRQNPGPAVGGIVGVLIRERRVVYDVGVGLIVGDPEPTILLGISPLACGHRSWRRTYGGRRCLLVLFQRLCRRRWWVRVRRRGRWS